MTTSEASQQLARPQAGWKTSILVVTAFSLVYFLNVCVRASEKYFWYDELLTVYFSRLPDLDTLWKALQTGVDSNPPGFFLLTRLVEAIFGEGPISTRVPEIVGFWMFCVCVFIFVNRKAGPIAGSIAMLFPLFTGAFYYAYEARPHAIVLGFCGVALVCWQSFNDADPGSRNRTVWQAAFSFALLGSFMLHGYALVLIIPFGAAELVIQRRSRRVDDRFWIALILPIVPAVLVYLPLQRYFKKLMEGTPFLTWFPSNWIQLQNLYVWLLAPCILLLVVTLMAMLANLVQRASMPQCLNASMPQCLNASMPQCLNASNEIVVSANLLLLPFYGIVMAKLVHGPFFARYFLSALAGICILLGLAFGRQFSSRWTAFAVLAVLAVSLGVSSARLLYHRIHHVGEQLVEPSTGAPFESDLANPAASYSPLLSQESNGLPVALLNPQEYLALSYYAPELAKRVYCPLPTRSDISYRILQALIACCRVTYNPPLTDEQFLRAHPEFIAYGSYDYLHRLSAMQRYKNETGPLRTGSGHFWAVFRLD